MLVVQLQIVETRINKGANTLKELKHFFKEFNFIAGMLKEALDLRKVENHETL